MTFGISQGKLATFDRWGGQIFKVFVSKFLRFGLVWVEFNTPPDTVEVISETVFTANHLTDTDKQNSRGKYK